MDNSNSYGDNSILGGYHACWCALPAMNDGSTECCKHCANNPCKDKDILKEWQNFNIDEIKNDHIVIE